MQKQDNDSEESQSRSQLSSAQIRLISFILVLALAVVFYRWLVLRNLEQTSALFIGLPAVVAILFSLLPRSKYVTLLILKGLTIFLAMSGIVLGEGMICIMMASPLFLGVGLLVGLVIDAAKHRKRSRMLLGLLLLPFALEGTPAGISFNRNEVVSAEIQTSLSATQIESRLASSTEFNDLPAYFQMGFPMPSAPRGKGISVGSLRCIYFSGGEGNPGDLCVRVVARGDSFVEFRLERDDSHIAHWLTWKRFRIDWRDIDQNDRVTMTIAYRRDLDPAWYFAPIERSSVEMAAEYFLHSYLSGR